MVKSEAHPRGKEIDHVMDLDREWFRKHPERQWHIRYAHPVERFELSHFGDVTVPYDKVAVVVVRRLGEGLRARSIMTMRGQGPYDLNLTDAEIEELFL